MTRDAKIIVGCAIVGLFARNHIPIIKNYSKVIGLFMIGNFCLLVPGFINAHMYLNKITNHQGKCYI